VGAGVMVGVGLGVAVDVAVGGKVAVGEVTGWEPTAAGCGPTLPLPRTKANRPRSTAATTRGITGMEENTEIEGRVNGAAVWPFSSRDAPHIRHVLATWATRIPQ
jgi:hypothetical protein